MAQDPHLIQIRELKDTISQLNSTIALLNETLQESRKRESQMQEQIDYLTKKLFGRSSEKHITQTEGQLSFFDEAENEADPEAKEPDEVINISAHTRKAKKTNKDKYAGLPVRDTMIEMAKAHKLSPFAYLNLVLTNRPGENPSNEELSMLAPWSDLAQEHCSLSVESSK